MLTMSLDHTSPLPLYEQIYAKIKVLIQQGELAPPDKLPSERSLALNLQISRNTVNMAYAQLLSEGYIHVKAKSGYYISATRHPAKERIPSASLPPLKETPVRKKPLFDFSPFSLDTDGFPHLIWERLYKWCMREYGKALFLPGERRGDEKLRVAIAKYLHEFRGFFANPDNILIGAGADYLLQLLHQLLPKEAAVAMEDPSYLQAYRIFSSLGRTIDPIPLDEKGPNMTFLKKSSADIVYLTPSHQFPIGSVMPISRRLDIYSRAAEKEGRYIIEDDHDSEFRYKGKPIPSMKENDKEDKVIHIGTFSRTISPAIRIGFMVLPDHLLQVYKNSYSFYSSTVPRIEQAVLAEFISGGFYERHINKSRKLYKVRHDALLSALKRFGDRVEIFGENAGVHMAVKFHFPFREDFLKEKALIQGIGLHGLSPYFISSSERKRYEKSAPVFLMGYGNMTESELDRGISLLYQLLTSL